MELLLTVPLLRAKTKLHFARPGANPTLALVEMIRDALKRVGEPVSRNWLLEQLSSWGHGTSRQALNAALRFLMEDGSVVEGSKGVMWIPPARGKMLELIRTGRRL